MKLGQIIKNYRSTRSLTLEQMSEKAGLSKGFISRLESGDYDQKNVSLESIIKLAKGLDVKVKEIFDNLNVIEQEEPTSLRIYLRKKYKINDARDSKLIEDLINNIREKDENI
jgi:transcriptional regulator with XRE-family HTH domain